MYYTKNAKDPHPEFMENALGCQPRQTATLQKETFQSIVMNAVGLDEKEAEKVYTEVQEGLNTMIEEHKKIYESNDAEPVSLSKEVVKSLLEESGVSVEAIAKIESSFEELFGDDEPLAEHLIDKKVLKANEHKKKEKALVQQVVALESKLEAVRSTSDPSIEEEIVQVNEPKLAAELAATTNYDVVLHVKPHKLAKIKTELINGQRCLVIPMDEDEQATINGRDNLV